MISVSKKALYFPYSGASIIKRRRGTEMGLVVVNPNNKTPAPFSAIEPPWWCAYIASLERSKGVEVAIVDAEAEGLSVEDTVKRIDELNPDLVNLVVMGANPSASSTPKMDVTIKLSKILKHDVVVSGLHPSALRDLTEMETGREVVDIPIYTDVVPAWDLLPMEKYRAHNWHCLHNLGERGHYAVIYTGFGCPNDCYYCNIHALYTEKIVRNAKYDTLKEEIEILAELGVKNLKICDELFAFHGGHVQNVCDILEPYNFNIWCYGHVKTVRPYMLQRMKRAGVNWICYGFESASDTVLNGVSKKQTAIDMLRASEMAKEAGINILGNFIFGLPDDDEETMQETLELAIALDCEYVNFYTAMAYPGSKLYEDTAPKDLPARWRDYSQFGHNSNPLPTKYLTPIQVRDFRDFAFEYYYSRPEYLDMIRHKFGREAERHIQEMNAWLIR